MLRAVALRCSRSGRQARESILGIVESMTHYEVEEKVKGALPSVARGQGDMLGIRFNRRSLGRRIISAQFLKTCCRISWILFYAVQICGGGEFSNFYITKLSKVLRNP